MICVCGGSLKLQPQNKIVSKGFSSQPFTMVVIGRIGLLRRKIVITEESLTKLLLFDAYLCYLLAVSIDGWL